MKTKAELIAENLADAKLAAASMTRAELESENNWLRTDNNILRDQLRECHDTTEWYLKNWRLSDKVHDETMKELSPLVDLRTEARAIKRSQSDGGSKTPYDAIHEEARRFYQTGEYTPWGAAKKAVKLAERNPGEFHPLLPKDADGKVKFPTVDAVNKALKKWLEEQK
jgi:hypothetical protein